MNPLSDQKIIDSWKKNASPWIQAIANGEIQSRIQVTNQLILDAIMKESPKTILDVGCGEGWLIRYLSDHGIAGMGIDIVPELIEYANQKGIGQFVTMAYEDVSLESIGQTFDVMACNFSLLGNESVLHIFQHACFLLNEAGALIIQTIHPNGSSNEGDYQDGWRSGSWTGFSKQFSDPAPWYFRTIDSWKKLYKQNHFVLDHIIEPVNPVTNQLASILFVGRKKSRS